MQSRLHRGIFAAGFCFFACQVNVNTTPAARRKVSSTGPSTLEIRTSEDNYVAAFQMITMNNKFSGSPYTYDVHSLLHDCRTYHLLAGNYRRIKYIPTNVTHSFPALHVSDIVTCYSLFNFRRTLELTEKCQINFEGDFFHANHHRQRAYTYSRGH